MKSKYINDFEYSNFSQNGEDGIIDFLTQNLLVNNKIFFEIGCGNGLENNSTNLILNDWMGFACDIPRNIYLYNRFIKALQPSKNIESLGVQINLENIDAISKKFLNYDISFFSLDIDSYDFYILSKILKNNILPKIICVEYNSFLGHDPLVVKYIENFNRYLIDKRYGLYFGASLSAWKLLLFKYNYKFICVDKNGVNAFFIKNDYFNKKIIDYEGLNFEYTKVYLKKYNTSGEVLQKYLIKEFSKDLLNASDVI